MGPDGASTRRRNARHGHQGPPPPRCGRTFAPRRRDRRRGRGSGRRRRVVRPAGAHGVRLCVVRRRRRGRARPPAPGPSGRVFRPHFPTAPPSCHPPLRGHLPYREGVERLRRGRRRGARKSAGRRGTAEGRRAGAGRTGDTRTHKECATGNKPSKLGKGPRGRPGEPEPDRLASAGYRRASAPDRRGPSGFAALRPASGNRRTETSDPRTNTKLHVTARDSPHP